MSTRDCVCFQDFCAEIEVLQDEVARLRDVLIETNDAFEQLCIRLDVDPEETFYRVKNSKTGGVWSIKSLADIFAQARAALAEQGEK